MPTILATLIAAIGSFALKLFMSIATEKYIAKAFFYIADEFAKKSNNGIDDEIVKQLKDAYYNQSEK